MLLLYPNTRWHFDPCMDVLFGWNWSLCDSLYATCSIDLIVAVAALSILITIAAGVGIIATISESPSFARLFTILFNAWFYLQMSLDVAIITLLFTKRLDSLLYECGSLTGLNTTSSALRNCERSRNRASLYYTTQAVIRDILGFYFTRRVVSFSRHCASLVNPPATIGMAPMSGPASQAASTTYTPSVPTGDTVFASNFPGTVQRQPYEAQIPAPGQATFTSQGFERVGRAHGR